MARIAVDSSIHEFYVELTEKGATRPALFKTMKDAFMFNFGIGVRNGVRVSLNRREEIFGVEVLDRDIDLPLLLGVYLAETEDMAGLSADSDERISAPVMRLCEEYANAGAQIVRAKLNVVEPEVSLLMILALDE